MMNRVSKEKPAACSVKGNFPETFLSGSSVFILRRRVLAYRVNRDKGYRRSSKSNI